MRWGDAAAQLGATTLRSARGDWLGDGDRGRDAVQGVVEPCVVAQHAHDPLRSAAVPTLDHRPRWRAARDGLIGGGEDRVRTQRYQAVRPLVAGDRSFRIGPHGDAGNAEEGRLLLQAARVGDHKSRSNDEPEHLHVAYRVDETQLSTPRPG